MAVGLKGFHVKHKHKSFEAGVRFGFWIAEKAIVKVELSSFVDELAMHVHECFEYDIVSFKAGFLAAYNFFKRS